MTTLKKISTSDILKEMLTENTGSHFLDSGGAYGRNWERNQKRDFESEPATLCKFSLYDDHWEFNQLQHNLYHWLYERVNYDRETDEKFQEFCNREEYKHENYFELLGIFTKDVLGINWDQCDVVNTYNGEDLLSQVIQWWDLGHGDHLVISIHQGCDVRGGYGRPVFFEGNDGLYDNARVTISCGDHHWGSDDGGNRFDYDGCYSIGTDLARCEAGPYSEMPPELTSYQACAQLIDDLLPDYMGIYWAWDTLPKKYLGPLYIDEEGKGYCPICHRELHAYSL